MYFRSEAKVENDASGGFGSNSIVAWRFASPPIGGLLVIITRAHEYSSKLVLSYDNPLLAMVYVFMM